MDLRTVRLAIAAWEKALLARPGLGGWEKRRSNRAVHPSQVA